MSFTTEISEELIRLPVKKTCCRKALLLGLLCASRRETEQGGRVLYFYHAPIAELTDTLLDKVFHAKVERSETVRAGRKTFVVSFRSQSVDAFLSELDGTAVKNAPETVGFRCASCAAAFLRGVFLATATVSDPTKGYHLEMLFPTEGRANFLAQFLRDTLSTPSRARRKDRFGCVYKSNGAISDLLYFMGCAQTSFAVANACIERDIRNNENRATNCVASNISRSVDASARQRAAIERLIETRRIDGLSEELRYTAELRMEYPSASLLELSLLHIPPITKSGLNRRLSKLVEAAEEE